MLSFYRPAFLWGLVFLAAPIIIHFFNRRRSVLLDFSTVRFFRITAVRASKIRRLKRLVLLCSRCLLIAVIVALFAKPYSKSNPFAALSDPNGAIFCWIDPTISMKYKDGNVQLWERALSLLDSLNKKLPLSSQQYWFSDAQGGFIPKEVITSEKVDFTRNGLANPEKMFNSLKNKIRNFSGFPLLVIVSDFQDNVSRALDSMSFFNQAKIPIMCVSVAPHAPWNFGILKASVSREHPSTIVSTISAQGRPCNQTGMSVVSGGMRLGHNVVSVKTNEHVTINTEISKERGGFVSLDIEDPFSFDNVNYFVTEGNKSFRVLVIGDSSKCFPIAAAFRSMQKEWWDPVIVREPRLVSYSDIDSADCIVLNEVSFLPRAIQLLVSTRSMGAKSVLFSPGVDSGSVIAGPDFSRIMSSGRKLSYRVTDKPRFLVFSDTLSELWKGFHGLNNVDVGIVRYCDSLRGAPLCKLDNGSPFASFFIDSIGNSWVIFASPIGLTQSNNLCETGIFVPFLDRVSRFALASIHKDVEEWVAGKPRRNPCYGARHPALVDNEQGKRVAQWDNQPLVVFNEPGIYRIQPFGLPSYQVAVNIDPEEALFTYRFPNVPSSVKDRVKLCDYGDFLNGLHDEKGPGFFHVLWIMLAALILAEVLLWEKVDKRDNK
jgi:hypothetical protein